MVKANVLGLKKYSTVFLDDKTTFSPAMCSFLVRLNKILFVRRQYTIGCLQTRSECHFKKRTPGFVRNSTLLCKHFAFIFFDDACFSFVSAAKCCLYMCLPSVTTYQHVHYPSCCGVLFKIRCFVLILILLSIYASGAPQFFFFAEIAPVFCLLTVAGAQSSCYNADFFFQ